MVQGKQSILFDKEVYVRETASVVGQKEGEGPLGKMFDIVSNDAMFGAESLQLYLRNTLVSPLRLQTRAAHPVPSAASS